MEKENKNAPTISSIDLTACQFVLGYLMYLGYGIMFS